MDDFRSEAGDTRGKSEESVGAERKEIWKKMHHGGLLKGTLRIPKAEEVPKARVEQLE